MYEEITRCRMCGCSDLSPILDLGVQYLTGVFPNNPDAEISKGPLQLVLCSGCGLLQLRQSFALAELYGDNYGYRSGLNSSMIRHLQAKASMFNFSRSLMSLKVSTDPTTSPSVSMGVQK